MPGPNSLVVVFFFLNLFIFLTSTQAQVSHSTPRHQLKRRSRSSGGSDKTVVNTRRYIPTYNWEQKEYVKAHNDLREESGVPPLQWHPDLANSSNNWANELQDTCDYRHHSKGVYGENIFWGLYKEFTPTDVVRKWFSEKMHFDHTTNLCKCQPETDKCECGHYLNVVWKTSQWVGCSNAIYCKEAKGLIVVCQYDPPGNYKGLDPLNPKFSDDDDDNQYDDKGAPTPPAINTSHGALSSHPPPTSTNSNHRASTNLPPPPPAINTSHPPLTSTNSNHRASTNPPPPRPPINYNNHRASSGHPPPPPPAINTSHGASSRPPSTSTINNNHRGSRHHQQSPTSMNGSKVSGPPASPNAPIVNGSRESKTQRGFSA